MHWAYSIIISMYRGYFSYEVVPVSCTCRVILACFQLTMHFLLCSKHCSYHHAIWNRTPTWTPYSSSMKVASFYKADGTFSFIIHIASTFLSMTWLVLGNPFVSHHFMAHSIRDLWSPVPYINKGHSLCWNQ